MLSLRCRSLWVLKHSEKIDVPEGGGQPDVHAVPAGQQVGLVLVPHGVVPAWHPQVVVAASRHATPLVQQPSPHGVLPFGQQHPVLAF